MNNAACCSLPWCLSSPTLNSLPTITVATSGQFAQRGLHRGLYYLRMGRHFCRHPPNFRPGCDHANRPAVEPKPYAALELLNFLIL
jgi:hypothetical protein